MIKAILVIFCYFELNFTKPRNGRIASKIKLGGDLKLAREARAIHIGGVTVWTAIKIILIGIEDVFDPGGNLEFRITMIKKLSV